VKKVSLFFYPVFIFLKIPKIPLPFTIAGKRDFLIIIYPN
jgi:hypothetical protein